MKHKIGQKIFALLSALVIIFNSVSPMLAVAYANEIVAPTPEVTQEVTPTPQDPTLTPEPTIQQPTETVAPTPTVDQAIPTETITPTPDELTATPTPENTTEISATETQANDSSPPSDNSSGNISNNSILTVTPSASITPIGTPTPTQQSATGNEELSLVIIENITAPAIDLTATVAEGSAVLKTDKDDYAPTDTALIMGSKLLPNTTYSLTISSSDEPAVSTTAEVESDENGEFAYAYQLDGTYRPNYKAELRDPSGTIVATTTFTDGPYVPNYTDYPDSAGANDEPGQKDLTRLGRDLNVGDPLYIYWNWDEILMSGSNTADACALFDTNNNGFANYSLCVTWEKNQQKIAGSPTLYSCSDTRVDRCASSVLITTAISSICSVANSSDDPFSAGSSYPNDTKAICSIPLGDVGGALHASLLDVCSYPSTQPNSDPSDCIIIRADKGNLTIIKDVSPDNANTNWNFSVSGPISFNSSISGDGTSGINSVDLGTYSITETAGNNTSLSDYNTTWTCNKNGSTYLSGSGTTVSDIVIGKAGNIEDSIVCTFTNTINAVCGDGQINQTSEQCDDGAQNGTICTPNYESTCTYCSSTCQNVTLTGPYCGDNIKNGTEQCDGTEGVPTHYTCTQSCTLQYVPYCGDGLINQTSEQCDDGNNTNGDGCNATCQNEPGTLTVIKHVVNDNGGTKNAGDFTINVTGGIPTSFAGSESGTSVIVTAGGSYSVSEGAVSGYSASYLGDCSGTMPAGGTKTCMITNDDVAPKLTLVKTVINDNGGKAVVSDFPLFINGDPVVSGVKNTLSANVPYTATETTKIGYAPSVWGGDCAADGTITLQPGDDKTCTITNDDIAPTLRLVKTVTTDNGGTDVAGDWDLTARRLCVADSTDPTCGFTDLGDSTDFHTLLAGKPYSLSESGPDGYTQGSWSCNGGTKNGNRITLGLDDDVTCTINNDDQAGHLIVHKVTNPTDTATEFSVTASGTGNVINPTQNIVGGSSINYSVDAGTYSATEAAKAGWDETENTCKDVAVANGETEECTITNTKRSHIIIVKDVIGNPDPTDFTFHNDFGNGNDATFLLDEDSNATLPSSRDFEVLPGTYVVTEDPVGNWQSPESTDCTNDETIDSIDVAPGETVTCTFVNEELVGIVLIKNTIGGNGTFDFDATGTDLPSDIGLTTVGGTATQTFSGLDQDNEYSISENVPEGWDLTSAVCDKRETPDDIDIEPGEMVTCTFTNTKKPKLTVIKTTDPANDTGKFNLSINDTEYATDVGNNGTTNAQYANIGANTFAEAAGTGTNLSDYASVVSGTDCGGTATAGTINLAAGDDKTCTITNTRKGSITIEKVTVGGADSFIFTGDVAGTLSNNETATVQVVPGTYVSTEAAKTGWALTDITCSDSDSSGVIATGIATFIVAAGENVTCTFTNNKPAAQIDLDPLRAANKIGENHVITANVQVQNGNGVWEPAIDGTIVTFLINNSNGATATFVPASPSTCTTTAGTCSITINSPTAGNVSVHASVSPVVLGVTLPVATGTGGDNRADAQKDYVNARIGITPNTPINEVNDDHGFTVKVEQSVASGVWTNVENAIVNAIANPPTSLDVSDCNAGTDSNGECAVTVNSSVAGVFTIIARSTINVNGVEFKLQTNGLGENSQPAEKTYVDASIELTPQEATNNINDPHTIIAHVTKDNGSGVTNAEGVMVTLAVTPGTATFVGGDNDCITNASGECMVQIVDSAPGANIIDATTTFSVGGVSLTRATNGNSGPDGSDSAEKIYKAGRIIIEKQTLPEGSTQSFEFDPSWTTNFSLTDGSQNDSGWLTPGIYSVDEVNIPTDWDKTNPICSDGSEVSAIDVSAGETVTCTFTNIKRGSITVSKVTNPVSVDQFNILLRQNDSTLDYHLLSNGQSWTFDNLLAGNYGVSEVYPAGNPTLGWYFDYANCDGNYYGGGETLNLSVGQNISCTLYNEQMAKVTVHKDIDTDGDGTVDVTNATDWKWNIDGSGDYDTGSTQMVFKGDIDISEVQKPDYHVANLTCGTTDYGAVENQQITVNPGDDITCTFTNTRDTGALLVHKVQDTQGNGTYDTVDSSDFTWGIASDNTPYSMGSGQTLTTGNYSVYESTVPGYQFVGWFFGDPVENRYGCDDLPQGNTQLPADIDVLADSQTEITLCNQLQLPVLTITKTNDAPGLDQHPGNDVVYTLTVTATQSAALDVTVTDLLPQGFTYRASSWTATSSVRGDLKALGITTEPTYHSPGTWKLGDMQVGETVTLTLIADISGDQQPGRYKDIAWARGTSLSSQTVLALASGLGNLDASDPYNSFVGTDVNVIKDQQSGVSVTVQEAVLGASIILPATGGNSIWIIIALAILGTGLSLAGIGYIIQKRYV